ncbi:head GIN domain-containing protein [Massilia soli]|uniref:DUF2807 domain-containing protein n=1 Tax=Massilia soli TaxID=2792854 RepID=A0ABS7SPM3_9BURK|nr:head GIN domain-containing protein [Massilia soli]MBZ2207075.1 DUF2807 domain-containing protein [Massilia soli]
MKTTTTIALRHLVLAFAAITLAAPVAMVSASPLDWIVGDKVRGNGAIKKQSRALAHFTGLSLNVPAQLELRIGNTEGISIETDDNLLPLIETTIDNGTLKIRPLKKNMNLNATSMKIIVHARDVNRIALGGSGTIRSDALRGERMQFDLGGSGSIDIKSIDGDAVSVTVGGSGNFKTGGGSANTVSVSIGGSGDVDMGRMAAGDASVSVAGSGTAEVWARDNLSATIAGSGDVNYRGDPKISRSVVGSGDVTRVAAR